MQHYIRVEYLFTFKDHQEYTYTNERQGKATAYKVKRHN